MGYASNKEKNTVHRQFQRAHDWALKQRKEALAVHFAGIFASYRIERKMYREALEQCDQLGALAMSAGGHYAEAAAKLTKQYQDRRRGYLGKSANDPKVPAMEAIKAEWERRHRPGGKFAHDMAIKYQGQGVDISEGGIKNAITRWRKEPSSC